MTEVVPARFIHHCVLNDDNLLVEAVLPCKCQELIAIAYFSVGSITGIFRSIIGRSVVIEGRIDKLKLSITDKFPSESDVLEFRIPAEYCFTKMAVSLDAAEGRVVLKVPKA